MKRFIDCLIAPLFIFFFAFDPLFSHGFIVPQDEGQHLAWINSILHDRVIYRDIYMFYGPLLEYIPVLLMRLLGPSVVVLRAFYHLGMILGLILSYFLARMILKKRLSLYLVALLLITTKIAPFWSARWGGPRMALGITALIFLMVYLHKGKWPWLYISGLISGMAFLTSQDIGLCSFSATIVFLTGANIAEEKIRWQRMFGQLVIYGLGILTLILPFFLYLIFTGALPKYLKICFYDLPFLYTKIFVDPHPLVILLKGGITGYQKGILVNRVILFFFVIIVYLFYGGKLFFRIWRKKFKPDDIPALILVGFGLPLLLLSTRQLEGMQFNMSAPPSIILGCLLIEKIFHMTEKRTSSQWRNIIMAVGLIGLSIYLIIISTPPRRAKVPLRVRIKSYGKITGEGLTHGFDPYVTPEEMDAWDEGWGQLGLERAKNIYVPLEKMKVITDVAYYLKWALLPNESILVFPHEGQYYFLLDRVGPTRFDSLIYASITPEYQQEVIQALEKNPVRYIIYVKDSYVFTNFKKIPNEERLRLIFNYISENYYEEKRFGQTYILRRKET